jgi:hypothetical protein
VAADIFNLRALGLPEKSRILDQRPDRPKVAYHFFDGDASEKRLDSIIGELEALATRPENSTHSPARNWFSVSLIVLGVILCLLSIVALHRYRRRFTSGVQRFSLKG